MRGGDDEEIDSEDLLKQGDELLRSSRELLDDLADVVPASEPAADAATEPPSTPER